MGGRPGHSEGERGRGVRGCSNTANMPRSGGEEISITIRRGGRFLPTGAPLVPPGGVREPSSAGPLGGHSSLRGRWLLRARTVSGRTHFSRRRLATVSSTPPRGSFHSSWRFQPSAPLTGRALRRAGRARPPPRGGARTVRCQA